MTYTNMYFLVFFFFFLVRCYLFGQTIKLLNLVCFPLGVAIKFNLYLINYKLN